MYKGAGKSWEGSAATDTGLESSLALELMLSGVVAAISAKQKHQLWLTSGLENDI